MYIHARVEGLDLSLVNCEVTVAIVTDVDCFGAIAGKLVGTGTSDTIWRVGALI